MAQVTAHSIGDEAMRRVGWLLMKWGQLETKISHGIYLLTPTQTRQSTPPDKVARTLKRMLAEWENAHQHAMGGNKHHMGAIKRLRTSIETASKMRNIIAHGLASIIFNEAAQKVVVIVCYESYHQSRMTGIGGAPITYTIEQLDSALELAEGFIIAAMMLNQDARVAIGK